MENIRNPVNGKDCMNYEDFLSYANKNLLMSRMSIQRNIMNCCKFSIKANLTILDAFIPLLGGVRGGSEAFIPTPNPSKEGNSEPEFWKSRNFTTAFPFLLLSLFTLFPIKAQVNIETFTNDTITAPPIETIQITATKIETENLLQSPIAVTVIKEPIGIKDSRQQISLQESLLEIPGLYSLNANNYAQDLRVSIRGFGARAGFGIRGVKIIVDGIPETTPDGQGQVDNLNLESIQSIEVLKGPAAVLYGNASGGVINIKTLDKIEKNFVEAGVTFGSFTYNGLPDSIKLEGRNMQRYQLKAGFKNKKTSYLLHGNYTQSDGYRLQSGVENFNINARVLQAFSKKSKLSLQANYTNSPWAEDPGGLNLEAINANRVQARDQNVLFKTGEEINQFKFGANYDFVTNKKHKWNAYGFFSNRNFVGLIPTNTGWIELNRNYYGQGASYQLTKIFSLNGRLPNAKNELRLGYDISIQRDERERFENLEGVKGAMILNQLESFDNVAGYLLDHLTIGRLFVNAGIRYDWNELKARDYFTEDGNDSGSVKLSAFNPSVGLSYRVFANTYIYSSYRTGFETPSLIEISNNPEGLGGFNRTLLPQKSNNFEIGIKGGINKNRNENVRRLATFDITYFHINTNDELIKYGLEAFPESDFYRNAGKTTRNGIELGALFNITSNWLVKGTYTFSDFVYKDYVLEETDLTGNQLPGIPKHFGSLSLNHHNDKGLSFRLQSRFNGALFTNDSNEVEEEAYVLLNLSAGYHLKINPSFALVPFFGINNLLNEQYNDNIRINAPFGGRFYEPAPGLNLYGGLRLKL